MDNQEASSVKTNKNKIPTPYFIVIGLALIGVIAFFYFQNKRLEEEKEAKQLELDNTIIQLDSISTQLNNKILTISQLGGEIDTLLKVQSQLEEDKKTLIRQRNNERNYAHSLKDKVDGYQELLLLKDEEIAQLQKIAEELMTENTELKEEKQVLAKSIDEINEEKAKLQEKVAFASRLSADEFKVVAVSASGREREDEFKNRHIDRIKINFTVMENSVAPIEGKELLIRVVAPDGNVLFDVARGSGSFTYEGREMFFTQKQEILFDKNSQNISLFYTKGSEYAIGKHQVEVYTDDYLMGKGSFIVK
ncbi:MAG: chromosome segregation protein SMC [Cyclobacteriaceae bacterium]